MRISALQARLMLPVQKVEELDDYRDPLDAVPQSEEKSGELLCSVCGDLATGRHYGAIACNGCKGFFRRTIRRGYKYSCRFNSNCNIDKHNRAVCRFCRYTRCIRSGMKVDAVQNERDVIGKRPRASSLSQLPSSGPTSSVSAPRLSPPSSVKRHQSVESNSGCHWVDDCRPPFSLPRHSDGNDAPWETPTSILESLLRSEASIRSLRDTVIKQTGNVEYAKTSGPKETTGGERIATTNDIFLSIHSQLLLVIEWAKTLPPFSALSTDDQTALLKNFASQHVVLCVAYRSINMADSLQLINDSKIIRTDRIPKTAEFPSEFYLRDCERVMDQLVAPMRFLRLDDFEFVALKACVLFNPVARGLSPECVTRVLATRRKIFSALEHYVANKSPPDPNRIGDLTFFILSPLQSLANMISEDVLVTKLSGAARIDLLMEELILADTEEQKCLERIQSEIPPIKDSDDSNSPQSVSSHRAVPMMGEPTHFSESMLTVPDFGPSPTLSSYVLGPIDSSRSNSPQVNMLSPSTTVMSQMWGGSPFDASLFLSSSTF